MKALARPAFRDRWLEIQMFSGDVVAFRGTEFLRVVVHRYLLAHYVLVALGIALLEVRSGNYDMTGVEMMQVVVISITVAVVILVALPALAMVVLPMPSGVLRLRSSVLQVSATVLAVGTGQVALVTISGNWPAGFVPVLVMTVFYYLLCEAICHYVMLVVVPRVLRDMRGDVPQRPRSAPEDGGVITIRGERFAPETLFHLRADGNYIHVRTTDRRAFLPGPFGPVVDSIPEELGMRVSRSDWVARSAAKRTMRSGRDVTLELVDGTLVRVAHSRRKAVQEWVLAARQGASDEAVPAGGMEMSIQTGK